MHTGRGRVIKSPDGAVPAALSVIRKFYHYLLSVISRGILNARTGNAANEMEDVGASRRNQVYMKTFLLVAILVSHFCLIASYIAYPA